MKILSKVVVPVKTKHKVKSVICDYKNCQEEIAMGKNYYQLVIDRDDGEQGYIETMHFCENCVKLVLPVFISELDFLQSLEVSCHRRRDSETEEVTDIDELYGFLYTENMRFED